MNSPPSTNQNTPRSTARSAPSLSKLSMTSINAAIFPQVSPASSVRFPSAATSAFLRSPARAATSALLATSAASAPPATGSPQLEDQTQFRSLLRHRLSRCCRRTHPYRYHHTLRFYGLYSNKSRGFEQRRNPIPISCRCAYPYQLCRFTMKEEPDSVLYRQYQDDRKSRRLR